MFVPGAGSGSAGATKITLNFLSEMLLTFQLVSENASQFIGELISTKCRRPVAILSVPQGGQPPAAVFHRESIKNRDARSDEFGYELPSLFRGNRGIKENKMESVFSCNFRRDGLRRHEKQFGTKFLKGL